MLPKHAWIAEVLNDIVDYCEVNGLKKIGEVVSQAKINEFEGFPTPRVRRNPQYKTLTFGSVGPSCQPIAVNINATPRRT